MDCRQEEIVNGLLKSYQEVGGINHLDCSNLPSKRVIASLCEDLLHLLFIHPDCDLIKVRRCHPRPRTWLFAPGTENEDQ